MNQFIYSTNIVSDLADFFSSVSDNTSYFIVSDENTHKYCVPLISKCVPGNYKNLVMGTGEFNKNLNTCNTLWKLLINGGARAVDKA